MKGKTEKTFHKLNIVLMVFALVFLVAYQTYGGVVLKGATSFWFVAIGFVNLLYAVKTNNKPDGFSCLIFSGLVLGMCADVMLNILFMWGVILFALGHVMYLIAFYMLKKPCVRDLIFILPVVAISVFMLTETSYIQVKDAGIEKLLTGYAVIISFMLGKAVSNFVSAKSVPVGLLLAGAVLFWFSDLMLAFNLFGDGGKTAAILCAVTYWPGQCIIAYSLFYHKLAVAR